MGSCDTGNCDDDDDDEGSRTTPIKWTWILTGRVGPVLARGAAGLAEAHVVLGQDPEGVVHVGGQRQPRRGAGARHLRQGSPHTFGWCSRSSYWIRNSVEGGDGLKRGWEVNILGIWHFSFQSIFHYRCFRISPFSLYCIMLCFTV